jgi:DNA-binding CsgD family transcriptional regulator
MPYRFDQNKKRAVGDTWDHMRRGAGDTARNLHVHRGHLEDFTMRADGILEAIRKIYGAVLDRLDIGVILLDATGHPSFVNTRAADIAARGDGLNASRAGVTAALPAETRALQAAIAATAAEAAAPATAAGNVGSRRVYLSRPSGLSPLAVTVVAVTDIGGGDGQEARLALFIDDPEAPTRIDTSGLGAAYGLTPREAAVAALLSRGSDVTQAAKTLGIGVSSTRQYLKRVLDKTGTRRQANLVRLVLRSFAHSYG